VSFAYFNIKKSFCKDKIKNISFSMSAIEKHVYFSVDK